MDNRQKKNSVSMNLLSSKYSADYIRKFEQSKNLLIIAKINYIILYITYYICCGKYKNT